MEEHFSRDARVAEVAGREGEAEGCHWQNLLNLQNGLRIFLRTHEISNSFEMILSVTSDNVSVPMVLFKETVHSPYKY